jgi:CheY-like chemotaxis protein
LGLAIVKQLTELHGGRVRAASEGEGRGTTVIIELPLTAISGATAVDPLRVHSRATPLQPNFSKATSLAGVTVLVVDDEPDARELIKQVLEDHQARVLVATSADEARQVLNAQRPNVMLSDIGMAGQDGYQLLAEIRRAGNSIPAVALTAFARSEDRTRALRAGFQMHIAKPVEPEELLAAVASLAQRARG